LNNFRIASTMVSADDPALIRRRASLTIRPLAQCGIRRTLYASEHNPTACRRSRTGLLKSQPQPFAEVAAVAVCLKDMVCIRTPLQRCRNRFVSGHRFSGVVTGPHLLPPLGADAAQLGTAGLLVSRRWLRSRRRSRCTGIREIYLGNFARSL
jgi:hypothetical protein